MLEELLEDDSEVLDEDSVVLELLLEEEINMKLELDELLEVLKQLSSTKPIFDSPEISSTNGTHMLSHKLRLKLLYFGTSILVGLPCTALGSRLPTLFCVISIIYHAGENE